MKASVTKSLYLFLALFTTFLGLSVKANYQGNWVTVNETIAPFDTKRKFVHQVDINSITKNSKDRKKIYFNRRVIHNKFEQNKWVQGSLDPIGWSGSFVFCRKRGAIYISDSEGGFDLSHYMFRQSNGEWWNLREIKTGYRKEASGVFAQLASNREKLYGSIHALLCD